MSWWGSLEESNDFYDVLSSEWQHEYLPLDMVLPPPADLSPSSTWLPSINKFMVTKAKDILSLRLARAALVDIQSTIMHRDWEYVVYTHMTHIDVNSHGVGLQARDGSIIVGQCFHL